jgi:hypothetical protein
MAKSNDERVGIWTRVGNTLEYQQPVHFWYPRYKLDNTTDSVAARLDQCTTHQWHVGPMIVVHLVFHA